MSDMLPGVTVIVSNPNSIYHGYEGFVQRREGDKVAFLIDHHPWEKMLTMRTKDLKKK